MNQNIITFLACVCFLFLIGRVFALPVKKVLKLVFNSILGGGLIYVINIIGSSFEFHIGLNLVTSVLVRSFRYSGKYFPYISKNINIKITKGEYLKISPLVWKCFN